MLHVISYFLHVISYIVISFLFLSVLSWLMWGVTAGVVPSATMQSKDGKYVIIGGNGDSIYTRLMAAVGRPDMGSANPLYATNTHRCQRADEIYKVSPAVWQSTTLLSMPSMWLVA